VNNFWEIAATVFTAIAVLTGTIYASRRSARNEQKRIQQELTTILGTERGRLAQELEAIREKARTMEEDREKIRDEMRTLKEASSSARIEHAQAIAEKETAVRESQLSLHEVRVELQDCRSELIRVRAELERRGDLIAAQAEIITELRRNRAGG
jgi:chromosome segregation ATPase